jgi:hypothetical protein
MSCFKAGAIDLICLTSIRRLSRRRERADDGYCAHRRSGEHETRALRGSELEGAWTC